MHRLLSFVVACLVLTAAVVDAAEQTSPIGKKVENFELQGALQGETHSLAEFKSSKLVVVAYLGTQCPLAKLYAPRLAELAKEYADKGVTFIGINSNRQDSITELQNYARVHEIKFPLLKDVGNKVADQMGAVRTPEVFVLDKNRVVRYWGRIDDQYVVGRQREEATREDLKLAIDQLLDGKKVEVATTAAVGCLIGRIHEPKGDSEITYSKQVARIFQQRCVECHRDGEIAPFALTDYDEVAGWADTIAEVVRAERMPPWHAAPEHGHFSDDRRLSDEEKETIYAWVSAGAPEGDKADLPEPMTYTTGWQLQQEPDQVIEMADEPFAVPAEGTVKYQFFTTDPGFTEDKWVKAAEVIPGNRAVVHHVLIFVRPPGSRGNRGIDGLSFLAAYVPGLRVKPLPEGFAKHVPAGSQLVWQVHYTPVGSEQTDLSKVGFVFAEPKEVTHLVKTVEAINQSFEIPPQSDNHRVEAFSPTYPRNAFLLSMAPHMHLRGKAFSYELRYPDGKKEMLLDVPHYDFNWQTNYSLTEMMPFPEGAKMYCIAHFDNSDENLANPDPKDTVRWGDQTWEEMMIGFFDIAVELTDEERKLGKAPDIRPSARSQAERVMQRFDRNGDGKITQDEIPERGKFMFQTLDRDADGTVTLDEATEAVKSQFGGNN